MTKQEVLKCLSLIESIYSYCMVKSETVTYWFDFCAELDYENVMNNLCQHIRKSPYPPCITELTTLQAAKSNPGAESTNIDWMNEYLPKHL